MRNSLNCGSATTAISNNYFTCNHPEKKIVGSEHHFKLSGKVNTPQYAELIALMALRPDYGCSFIPPRRRLPRSRLMRV